MKTVPVKKNNEPIASVWYANGYFTRLRGLLGRKLSDRGGLLLTPCNAIHTIGMRYAIDAVYLDRHFRVLRVDASINPGKVCPMQRGARYVLELSAGYAAQCNVTVGDTLEVGP